MTKSSYRMLKWTLMAAMGASLATACVVSSGDGDDDTDIEDGGSSGKSTTTGGKSGSSTGGKSGSSTGGTGGSSTAGTTTEGGTPGGEGGTPGGEGGTPPTYMAGLCDSELGTMTPADVPSCDPADKDEMNACLKCMKMHCCEEWQACYGTNPTTACGYGPTAADDLGQFDCIQQCMVDGNDGVVNEDDLLRDCADMCVNQCDIADEGLITAGTQALVACTHDTETCLEACYPIKQ
jgi:hypothetical protein